MMKFPIKTWYDFLMFNFYYINLIILILLIIPSVFDSAKEEKEEDKDNPKPQYHNKRLELLERIGRYGTMFFYVVKLEEGKHASLISYLIPGLFVALYLLFWYLARDKKSIKRTITLRIIEMLLFLSSALIDMNYLLLAFLVIYAPCAIVIDIKCAKFNEKHSTHFNVL